jgi:small subunit ribosomal protein S7
MRILREEIGVLNMGYHYKRSKDNNFILARFCSQLLREGKKFNAEKTSLKLLRVIQKQRRVTGIVTLERCIDKAIPYVGLRAKKVGSVTYKIPVPLSKRKEISAGIAWVVGESCGFKKGKKLDCLEKELRLLYKGQGSILKKKKSLYQTSEANRVYIKYLS